MKQQFPIVVSCLLSLTTDLRCYCNLPDCVRTAYMCKSELGCFQELAETASSGRIGCLELLPTKEDHVCLRVSTSTTVRYRDKRRAANNRRHSSADNAALLRCCHEDMCNYVAAEQSVPLPEVSITIEEHRSDPQNSLSNGNTRPRSRLASLSQSPWFRLAVVIVPIAGVIVLLLLISFACALLRTSDAVIKDQQKCLIPPLHSNISPAVAGRSQRIQPKDTTLVYHQGLSRPHTTLLS